MMDKNIVIEELKKLLEDMDLLAQRPPEHQHWADHDHYVSWYEVC
jgi:hypothetical protein